MGTILTLFSYKFWSFFGPSLRGRYGPATYLLLILLFVPSAVAMGYFLGDNIKTADQETVVNLLAAVASGAFAFGFLFSLSTGISASASEIDFLMTAPVRPRQYLISDILFQLTMIGMVGGLAVILALVAGVLSTGRPLALVIPLLVLMAIYGFMVLMVSQVLTVMRIRFPDRPVRSIAVLLLFLSLVPTLSLADIDLGIEISDLPVPQYAFAKVGYAVLLGNPLEISELVTMAVYPILIAGLWLASSGVYFFYGVKPTLTGGFGQVDMSSRMAQQRKMIGGLGGITTRVKLRTDRGGDTNLMTRLHLVRCWRDGSMVFVAILIIIGIVPSMSGSPDDGEATFTSGASQIIVLPVAILGMMWSYYERDNLWLVVIAGRPLGAYFRGMMLSLMAIGLGVSLLLLLMLGLIVNAVPSVDTMALTVVAPIAAAIDSTALPTRIKVTPGAFSVAALGILFATVLVGVAAGYGAMGIVMIVGESLGTSWIGELSSMLVLAALLSILGFWMVTKAASRFRV